MTGTELKPVAMKMAKAPEDEWRKVMQFVNELEEEKDYLNKTDEELGRWVRNNAPPMFRVVFGYQVLVDNFCDPTKDTLEWKPELAALMAKKETAVP